MPTWPSQLSLRDEDGVLVERQADHRTSVPTPMLHLRPCTLLPKTDLDCHQVSRVSSGTVFGSS